MTHKLIKTDNYLLVVDDSDMVGKGYRLDVTRMSVGIIDDDFLYNARKDWFKKIIAHLPLNGSPILEGVDLLPPYSQHQEDGLEELAEINYPIGDWTEEQCLVRRLAFKTGYNKAREKYKYTEEDVWKAIVISKSPNEYGDYLTINDIIQSLHQYPTDFECETEYDCCKRYVNCIGCDATEDMINIRPKQSPPPKEYNGWVNTNKL